MHKIIWNLTMKRAKSIAYPRQFGRKFIEWLFADVVDSNFQFNGFACVVSSDWNKNESQWIIIFTYHMCHSCLLPAIRAVIFTGSVLEHEKRNGAIFSCTSTATEFCMKWNIIRNQKMYTTKAKMLRKITRNARNLLKSSDRITLNDSSNFLLENRTVNFNI